MKTYIALLRGINVGGRNLLPMKELVHLMEKNGYQNVKTYIQSGNVIFQRNKSPHTDLGSLIERQYEFKPEVMVLEEREFRLALENGPYNAVDGKLSHFYFCKTPPKINTKKLEALASESEQYYINDKVFYLHAPNGIGKSKLAANIETCLGVPTTGRNLNTVNKLMRMLDDAE